MIADACWYEALRTALERERRAVLVAVAATSGSVPREPGAAMVVTGGGFSGTIGGGHLEHEALRLAREALAGELAPAQWLVRFPLAARLGQCCGGVATLAFAAIDPAAASWLDAVACGARANVAQLVLSRIDGGELAAARLVVTADDARGTLGGEALDSWAVMEARTRLALPDGDSRAGSGIVSAGGVTLFAHAVRPHAFCVLVFGNGHVGRALIQVLGALPARVAWIDTREDAFPAAVPDNVEVVATDDPVAEVDPAPRGAYLAVMTHSHALDFDIVEAALGRDDWRYLGLIGSRAKRAQFERRLAARDVPPEVLARVTCPIGVGVLRSKEPGVIAVAAAAEMLALRERATAQQGARLTGDSAGRTGQRRA